MGVGAGRPPGAQLQITIRNSMDVGGGQTYAHFRWNGTGLQAQSNSVVDLFC